jgi:putative flippase GtrA
VTTALEPPVVQALTSHRPTAEAPHSSPRVDGRAANFGIPLVQRLRGGLGREVLTFGAIGVVSTAAYAVLYLAMRSLVGPVTANALALLVTAVGNTAANRRLTFGVSGRRSVARDQVGGLAALAVALAITTAAVNLLTILAPGAGHLVELAVLVSANALATVARFILLRAWIAGDRRPVGQSITSNPCRSEP